MKEAVIKLLRSSSNDDKILGLELLVPLVKDHEEYWSIVRHNMDSSEPKDRDDFTIDWRDYYDKAKEELK